MTRYDGKRRSKKGTERVLRLLDQGEEWIDGSGQRYRLEDMDRHHRANLIPLLRRNARQLQEAAAGRYYSSGLAIAEDPSDGVAAAHEAAEAELELPAEDWLERRPLMRRLVELERGRSIADRAITAARNRAYEVTHPKYRRVGT